MQDLGTLGGKFSYAYGINEAGQVVGGAYLADNVTEHAFLWTKTTGMQDLGALGGTFSAAGGINASGQIAGGYTSSANVTSAFIWDAAHGMRSLGQTASSETSGSSINSFALVVGEWLLTGSLDASKSIESKQTSAGFLWTRVRGLQSLNSLLVSKNILVITASAINQLGQIAAAGNNGHAILLTPIK
jgi:probable HAF family extracellular repeat protein